MLLHPNFLVNLAASLGFRFYERMISKKDKIAFMRAE